jgi:hypothetical protein
MLIRKLQKSPSNPDHKDEARGNAAKPNKTRKRMKSRATGRTIPKEKANKPLPNAVDPLLKLRRPPKNP